MKCHFGSWFTRCKSTHVCHWCVCQPSASSWRRMFIFMKIIKSPAASQRNVPDLGAREAICLESCLLQLVGLTMHPPSALPAWATLELSASEKIGTNLHPINPTFPTRPPFFFCLFELLLCFVAHYRPESSSLKDSTFLQFRIVLTVLTKWLMDICFFFSSFFYSVQV